MCVRVLQSSDLAPHHCIRAVSALCRRLPALVLKGAAHGEAQRNSVALFTHVLRCLLASKPLIMRHKLCTRAFDWMVAQVEERFQRSLCEPGTCECSGV